MAEQLLHGAQVRTAFEQVRGSRVPEAVRTDVRCAGNFGDPAVHDGADCALVDPPTARAQEQCGAGSGYEEPGSSAGQPGVEGPRRGQTEGDRSLLAALSE